MKKENAEMRDYILQYASYILSNNSLFNSTVEKLGEPPANESLGNLTYRLKMFLEPWAKNVPFLKNNSLAQQEVFFCDDSIDRKVANFDFDTAKFTLHKGKCDITPEELTKEDMYGIMQECISLVFTWFGKEGDDPNVHNAKALAHRDEEPVPKTLFSRNPPPKIKDWKGLGLNKGLMEWMTHKVGIKSDNPSAFKYIFDKLELALGKEKLMTFGYGRYSDVSRALKMRPEEFEDFIQLTDHMYKIDEEIHEIQFVHQILNEKDEESIQKLHAGNVYFREISNDPTYAAFLKSENVVDSEENKKRFLLKKSSVLKALEIADKAKIDGIINEKFFKETSNKI